MIGCTKLSIFQAFPLIWHKNVSNKNVSIDYKLLYRTSPKSSFFFLQKLSHFVFLNDIKSSFLLRCGASTGIKNRSTVFITGIVLKFYNCYRILWEVTVYLPAFCRGTWNYAKTWAIFEFSESLQQISFHMTLANDYLLVDAKMCLSSVFKHSIMRR